MDRDMVNCIHYLYHDRLTEAQLRPLLWCREDTFRPLTEGKVFAVDPHTREASLSPGVFEVLEMIEDQLRSLPKPDYAFGYPLSDAVRQPGAQRPAFLAISYAPAFNPVKRVALEAADAAGFKCEVTGDLRTPGNIVDQVWYGIRGADAVIADITGANANVFYELGLAHALGKEVIILSQQPDAPFDIRSNRLIRYDPNDLLALKSELLISLRSVSARYPHEGKEPKF